MLRNVVSGLALIVCSAGPVHAQEQRMEGNVETPLACDCVVIPALTAIEVEILEPLGSKTSRTGDMFAIRLSRPIMVGDDVAVAAGAAGMGEVVHAKKSGGGGVGGELLLAARYLEVDGRRLRLRSMRLSATGKDQTALANATAVAVGVFALAITGKNTDVAAGTRAEAKVAEIFTISRSRGAETTQRLGPVAPTVQEGNHQ